MNKQRPSIFQIVRTDYSAHMAVLFPVIFWVYIIYVVFFQPPVENTLLYIGIAMTAVAIPVLLWRIYFIFNMFDTGVETTAVVQKIGFHRGRGRVTYVYTHQGTRYSKGNAIMKTGRTRNIIPSKDFTVLVTPNNPKRAIIKELYSK